MSYLDRLRAHDDFLERPAPPSVKSAKTPLCGPFDTFGTATPGPSENIGPSIDTFGTALAGAFQKTTTGESSAQKQAVLHALPILSVVSPSHDFSESLPIPSAKSVRTPEARIGDAFERAIIAAATQGRSIVLADGKLEMPEHPYHRWLITEPDGELFVALLSPPATVSETQADHPGATIELDPEPAPGAALHPHDASLARALLRHWGETDETDGDEYLSRLAGNAEWLQRMYADVVTCGLATWDAPEQSRPVEDAPAKAICACCRHWTPDRINPTGGIGRCLVDAPASREPGSLWPWPDAEIRCTEFDPAPVTPTARPL